MQELEIGDTVIGDLEDFDLMVASVLAAKHRYFHRGGLSPTQLVFGCNPRLPAELLCDEDQDVVVLHDLESADDQVLTGVPAEFARQQDIRRRACDLAMRSEAKAKVSRAMHAAWHTPKVVRLGQWAFVWRVCSAGPAGPALLD